MNRYWANKELSEFFEIRSGDTHAVSELEPGDIPLVSCGEMSNGVVGFYDVPPKNRYRWAITVGYAGQPLNAKFHPYEFGTKDDVAVLLPKGELRDTTLLFVAAMLNRMRWRYSFGRKCYHEKMSRLAIPMPLVRVNDEERIDEDFIEAEFQKTPFWSFIQNNAKVIADPSVETALALWPVTIAGALLNGFVQS